MLKRGITLVAAMALLCVMNLEEATAAPALYSPNDDGFNNYEQMRYILKLVGSGRAPPRKISGQVSLRSPRSELVGDMAHAFRLYQIQELDRMYGQKSRPRFGKRNQNIQNEIPMYGYYESDNLNPSSEEEDLNQR